MAGIEFGESVGPAEGVKFVVEQVIDVVPCADVVCSELVGDGWVFWCSVVE